MFVLKSLIIAAMLSVACRAFAVDYNENAIMQIGDLFDVEKNNTILVQTIESVKRFQELHPELTIDEMDMMSNVKGQVVYTLGVRMRGDRLVGTATKNQSWPRPQNVSIQLTYPSQGVGAMVTYVYIVINQVRSTELLCI